MHLFFLKNYYIHAGQLIDTQNGELLKKKTIVVSHGLITAVENNFITPSDPSFEVIDLSNKTVLPGFIDMHVHIEHETNANQYLKEFTDNLADVAFESLGFAKTTLMAGFITVRDLGGSGVNIALRNAINAGKVEGPRIYTAGKSLQQLVVMLTPLMGCVKILWVIQALRMALSIALLMREKRCVNVKKWSRYDQNYCYWRGFKCS